MYGSQLTNTFYFNLVTFDNLHYLKAPVGTVEGLDISAYDEAVSLCLRFITYYKYINGLLGC